MSANEPPTPSDLEAQLGITAAEAQLIADAMSPLQDLTGVGSSLGSAMASADAPGPAVVGAVLESVALQVNLASTSAETLAHALDFYVQSQSATLEELFPPPSVLAQQVSDDAEPLVQAIAARTGN